MGLLTRWIRTGPAACLILAILYTICLGQTRVESAATIDLTECGKSKGCFRSPNGCQSAGCDHLVTWMEEGDTVHLELQAKIPDRIIYGSDTPWTAVGFSYDTKMPNTSVIACIVNGSNSDTVAVQVSFNIPTHHANTPLQNDKLGLVEAEQGSFTDGILACKFSRNKTIDPKVADSDKVFPLGQDHHYHILLATGPANKTAYKMKHTHLPVISPKPVSTAQNMNIGGQPDFIIDTVGCGQSKGCFRYPPECEMPNCDHIVTWEEQGEMVFFELGASVPPGNSAPLYPWTALGFSYDEKMPNTSVVDCILLESGKILVQESFNTGHHNEPFATNNTLGLVDKSMSGAYSDGYLMCKFTRYTTLNCSKFPNTDCDKVFNLKHKYYYILGTGPANATGYKEKHTNTPVVSHRTISVSEHADINGKTHPDVDIHLEDCGHKKGCFRYPAGCQVSDCDHLVTWKDRKNGSIEFELSGKVQGSIFGYTPWIAFGIANDHYMPDTSVIDCIVNGSANGSIVIQMSYNVGHKNVVLEPDNKLGLVNGTLRGWYIDGRVVCKFARNTLVNSSRLTDTKVFNFTETEKYYFLLASGPTDGKGTKHQHAKIPVVSPKKLSVFKLNDVNGGASYDLVKAHGSIMIITWMVIASFGTVIARFFKPTFAEFIICGEKAWFQIHRGAMVLVVLLALTAFVLIVVETEGFYFFDSGSIHRILGLIIIIMVIVNPAIAMLRPKPDAPRRPLFNWIHSIIGLGTHLLAIVAMYFGVQIDKANMPASAKWIVLAFGGWRLLVDMILLGHRCAVHRYGESGIRYKEMSSNVDGEDDSGSKFKFAVFVIFLVGAVGMASYLTYSIIAGQ